MAHEHFTAEALQEGASDAYGTYVVHRHSGDHIEGGNCWCYPLALSYAQVVGLSQRQLQLILDHHYRIH